MMVVVEVVLVVVVAAAAVRFWIKRSRPADEFGYVRGRAHINAYGEWAFEPEAVHAGCLEHRDGPLRSLVLPVPIPAQLLQRLVDIGCSLTRH
jgi:hypothetical protein